MTKNSINELIIQRDEILQSIKHIENNCEGIDNKSNAEKINTLNVEKARLLSDKKRLAEHLVELELQLNKINEDMSKLSGKGVDKILLAIKNQRWYFIKNKPKVLLDKNTGYLWANLDYFPYKSDDGNYTHDAAKTIIKSLELDGYKNWVIPTNVQMIEMIDDTTFPFASGGPHYIKDYYYWFVNWNNSYNAMYMYDYTGKSGNAYLLPCCTSLVNDNYKNNVAASNKVYTEKERLQFTLNLFINNKLEPIFKDQAITELYKKIYIEKPKLIKELNVLQEQIDSLQQEVLLSSTFDYNTLLVKYDINAIDDSVIKYYEAIQLWVNELMDKLHYFEEVKGDVIKDFNVISLKLSRKECLKLRSIQKN